MQASPETPSLHADELIHRSLNAMGCCFELILDPIGSPHDRFSIDAIADECVELIQDWHDRLSVYSCTSIASRINASPVGMPVRVDRELFELLQLCERLRVETEGAFNIAAGSLMRVHGFRDQLDSTMDRTLLDLAQAITLDKHSSTITRNDERIAIDFGAIAKGHVLDLITDELREYEIKNAFIHGGSSSAAGIGRQRNASPWNVLVSQSPPRSARLDSLTLGVSEHAGRLNEKHQGHIMDPRSCTPASTSIDRVVCVHASAAIADAYSTALSVHPGLIDQIVNNNCSVLMCSNQPDCKPVSVHDRLGVFSTLPPVSYPNATKSPMCEGHVHDRC